MLYFVILLVCSLVGIGFGIAYPMRYFLNRRKARSHTEDPKSGKIVGNVYEGEVTGRS
jgi:hypothetical protein